MHAVPEPQTILEVLVAQRARRVVAPAGIPAAVRASLVDAVDRARKTPAMIQRIESLGFLPILDDPAQFAATVRAEIEKYTGIARKARTTAGGTSGAASQ
jgi:tripartite-type tricarboxylate transporter receptor subunit TctC